MFFNRIILVGRVVADPEIRYLPSGTPVANFRIAVDRVPRQTQTGERIKETDFFRVAVFGKQADFVKSYLTKGRLVLVEGEMRMNTWEDEFGNRRVSYEVNAFRVRLLDRKPQVEEETFTEESLEGDIGDEIDLEGESFEGDEPPF